MGGRDAPHSRHARGAADGRDERSAAVRRDTAEIRPRCGADAAADGPSPLGASPRGLSANYLGSRRIRYSMPKRNVVGALMQYGLAERRMIAGAAVTKVLGEFSRRNLSAIIFRRILSATIYRRQSIGGFSGRSRTFKERAVARSRSTRSRIIRTPLGLTRCGLVHTYTQTHARTCTRTQTMKSHSSSQGCSSSHCPAPTYHRASARRL